MSLLVACPVILPPRADVLRSWTHRPHAIVVNGAPQQWEDVMIHDRAPGFTWLFPKYEGNRGVAASWNIAFTEASRLAIGYVAIISQSTILTGGTAHLADLVDKYADERGLLTDFAWRCIVLSTALWNEVGPFDERFWPAYYEDNDYVRRLELAGLHTPANPMPKVGRDLLDGTNGEAEALTLGLIDPACYGRNGQRYRDKWGGDPGHETKERPDG